jgi:uncharacterized protein YdhG (YjbR/CyaY superfamily)
MNSINEYIAQFPPEIREKLESVRQTIRKAEPEAVESISWNMPTYKLNGKPLAYFAGHKNHIGFYPIPSGIEAFKEELSAYKQSGKGTVQFPYKDPIPLDLIAQIIGFRAEENRLKRKK